MHGPNRRAVGLLMLPSFVALAAGSVPAGWTITGAGPQATEITRTCDDAHGGRCSVRLTSAGAPGPGRFGSGFGAIVQTVSAGEYAGHRVALSGWLKTDDAQAARLFLRADAGTTVAAFDNMDDRPVSGSQPWTRYSLAIDVPEGASAVAFGVLLTGRGRVWADDLELTIVDERDVASTDILPRDQVWRHATDIGPSKHRARPVNLDFEQ